MKMRTICLVSILLTTAGICHAQTVITQALAGTGIGGGDAPGFPVTIASPGYYVLGTNLSPPSGIDAIDITASGVTLDLNGFAIGGYQSCSQAPGHLWWTCSVGSYGIGISSSGDQTVVRNGNITGFSMGINLSGTSNQIAHVGLQTNATALKNIGYGDTFENVVAIRNGAGLTLSGQQNHIESSHVAYNGGFGLYVGSGTVSKVVAYENLKDGIYLKSAVSAQYLSSWGNGAAGINTGGSSVISNVLSRANTGAGIAATGRNSISAALALSNNGFGFDLSANTCYYQIGGNNNTSGNLSGGTAYSSATCF
jgi:hypothetical protein